MRAVTTGRQHSLAAQPQPPPPQLPLLSPNFVQAPQEEPRSSEAAEVQDGQGASKIQRASLASSTPSPSPSVQKRNPACSHEVTGDLCSCLVRTRVFSDSAWVPSNLLVLGMAAVSLAALHACTKSPRVTKNSVWRAQAGPPKELRVLGRDLEQTTAGLCPHTESGSGCLGSRCAGGRRSRPPRLARSQEGPRWL